MSRQPPLHLEPKRWPVVLTADRWTDRQRSAFTFEPSQRRRRWLGSNVKAERCLSVHRSAVSTTGQRFGSRCSGGWRLIGKHHEPHRSPPWGSADGGSARCPEEQSVSRALVRRIPLPSPC